MTTVRLYRNKRNHNKFIEVHNDGHRHNSVKQYLLWVVNERVVKNTSGDGNLHRWRKNNLIELLADYEEVHND